VAQIDEVILFFWFGSRLKTEQSDFVYYLVKSNHRTHIRLLFSTEYFSIHKEYSFLEATLIGIVQTKRVVSSNRATPLVQVDSTQTPPK
jgi:hypothetical protein